MSAMQQTLSKLQDNIDELTQLIEKLLDERTELITQLNAKKQRAKHVATSSDEHLQKDWLSDA